MIVVCEVVFKGRVQGVGFRYTARDMARARDITGWVMNRPDGSVQLLAEGEGAKVDELISGLSDHFYVQEKQVVRSAVRLGLTDFLVKY
ncbi:MAG: acylphosphatase [Candidatus Omnitrophica bacterium]|nr:acylphosphatase [Candidatus Omnitrophota bacterium]